MLLDLRKGTASSFPSFLTVLPSNTGMATLLFSASDGYFNVLPNDKDGKYSNCNNLDYFFIFLFFDFSLFYLFFSSLFFIFCKSLFY